MTGRPDRLPGRPKPAEPSAAAEEAPTGIDALSDVLRAVRLTGSLFFLVDASTPWIAQAPSGQTLAPAILPGAQQIVSFHVITEGVAWCVMAGQPPLRLDAGDVVVIPHGDPYALCCPQDLRGALPLRAQLEWFRLMAAGRLPFVVTEGGGGAGRLGVVCGFLGCDVVPFNPVVAALPPVLHVRRPAGGVHDRLAQLVEFAVAEARDRRPGSDCVRLRISELMFVEVVRRHVGTLPAEDTGWLAGLRDPVVGRALTLLHQRPAEPWTLERLGRAAGLSRSALAERFQHLVGHPPMQYLTHWRMQLAAKLLAEGLKVSAVALRVGYDSEAAFSRAFKRAAGLSPSAWRSSRPAAR
jgi:AraC-like DNA-binding protein